MLSLKFAFSRRFVRYENKVSEKPDLQRSCVMRKQWAAAYRRHRSNCCAGSLGGHFVRCRQAGGDRSGQRAQGRRGEAGCSPAVSCSTRELTDPRTSGPYKSIEALTRYDCAQRTYTTLKRTWRSAEGELLREEEVRSAAEMPVRSGSLDDKMLREVCRPKAPVDQQSAASKVAEKANEAAAELRKANEAMIQKEVQKSLKTAVLPAPAPAAAPAP